MKLFEFFRKRKNIPEGLWTKCEECKELLYTPDLKDNLWICPSCGFHFRINAQQRIDLILDEKERIPLFEDVQPTDPLNFTDKISYKERLKKAKEKSGVDEAIIFYKGSIDGRKVILGAMDFSFIGGSMGAVVGERFYRACQLAVEEKLPLIVFTSSGGARMQEGIISLMQMAKTTYGVGLLKQNKIPYIVVLTDPTMGGVSASFAFLGDIIIAEPKARIGFAGARVIEQTIKEKLPKGFQTAEFLLEHGLIDAVVDRRKLKEYLKDILDILYYSPKKNFSVL
jgi:acetyl-CoA carboxylase carboxyl transferase subunit beta